MGEFSRAYNVSGKLTESEAESLVGIQIIADAVNSGYTPDGGPFFRHVYGKDKRQVLAKLSVTENTRDGH